MTLEIELRGRIEACEAQRNKALTDHALAAGSLAVANAEKGQLQEANAGLERKVVELEKRLADLTPHEPPKE